MADENIRTFNIFTDDELSEMDTRKNPRAFDAVMIQ